MPAKSGRRALPVLSFAFGPSVLVIGIGAFLIRLAYLAELRDSAFFSVLIGDSLQYDAWAREIAAGSWLGTEVFYQSPLYPYVLATLYSLAGHDVFAVRVIQALLGATACVLLAMAGRRFFDDRTGLVAAALLAFYPPAIFFDGLIQKSSLDLFLLTGLLAALGTSLDQPRRRSLALAGIALGALAVNRENAQILYPVIVAWLAWWYRNESWRVRSLRIVVVTLGVSVVLLPVTLRNAYVGREWLISTSQSGPNFYIGNHTGATGTYEPLLTGRGSAAYEREDATRLAQAATGRTLSPREVSDYWWRLAFDEIRETPASWLALLARKAWLTVAAAEPLDTESIEAYADSSRILGALRWFSFGVLLALGAAGVWITRAHWRRLVLLYAMFLALACSVVLFYVFARYRYPLVPLAMLFAGAGLARVPSLIRGPARQWMVPAVTVLALGTVLHVPARTSADDTYLNYGTELLRAGRPAEALPLLERAVAEDPAHSAARLDLALALQQTQQPERAIEHFRAAVRLTPESAEANVGLAIALHQQGRLREAVSYYDQATRLRPDFADAMTNRAAALRQLGDTAGAMNGLKLAIAQQPQNLRLRVSLCSLVLETAPGDAAIDCLQDAAAALSRPEDRFQIEYTLAQALLGVNRVDEAVVHLERALSAARSTGNSAAVTTIEESLRGARARQ